MNQKGDLIKQRLYEELSILSEKMMKRIPPFESIPISKERLPYTYKKYLQYKDELDKTISDGLWEAYILEIRYFIKSRIFGHKNVEDFSDTYPAESAKLEAFRKWLNDKQTPGPVFLDDSNYDKSLNVKVIISQLMTREFKEFQYDKKFSDSSVEVFSHELNSFKMLIFFDKGSRWRHAIDVCMGIDEPWFCGDISFILGGGEPRFKYYNEETLTKGLMTAFADLKFILPHFQAAVERAFASVNKS